MECLKRSDDHRPISITVLEYFFNQIKREWAGCQIGSERTESGCFFIAVSRFSSLGWLHLLRIHELLSHPGRVIMRLALGHQLTFLLAVPCQLTGTHTLTSADGDMRGWVHMHTSLLYCTIAFASEAMQCKQTLVNKLEWGLQARWKVSKAQHFITDCKCWCKWRLLMFFQAYFNQIYW